MAAIDSRASKAADLVQDLAARAAAVSYAELPLDVTAAATRVVLDTLAVAAAGMEDELCSALSSRLLAAGGGTASVCTMPGGVPAATAALLNSMATTVLQYDEGHRESRSHPGIHVVPAALAVAEELDARGDRLIEAVVAGYDVTARIGMRFGRLPPDVHTHGTSGTFGAAVAAAKLLGAGKEELATTVEAAATVPLVPWQHTTTSGATVHHLYAAAGSQLGVTLAQAVASGVSATGGMLEGHYPAILGGERLGSSSRDGYEITRNYFKLYPACAHVAAPLEIVDALRAAGDWRANDVERIDVYVFAPAHLLAEPAPQTNLAARFSIPFLIGSLLTRGLEPRVFRREQLADPQVLAISHRVRLHHDSALDSLYPRRRPARVRIRLKDGRSLEGELELPAGDYERLAAPAAWPAKMQRILGHDGWNAVRDFVTMPADRWSAREVGAVFRQVRQVSDEG